MSFGCTSNISKGSKHLDGTYIHRSQSRVDTIEVHEPFATRTSHIVGTRGLCMYYIDIWTAGIGRDKVHVNTVCIWGLSLNGFKTGRSGFHITIIRIRVHFAHFGKSALGQLRYMCVYYTHACMFICACMLFSLQSKQIPKQTHVHTPETTPILE